MLKTWLDDAITNDVEHDILLIKISENNIYLRLQKYLTGVLRTVRTSPSALWQQTPTDRS